MSVPYWKTHEPLDTDEEPHSHPPALPVDEQHALPVALYFIPDGTDEAVGVDEANPLPFALVGSITVGDIVKVGPFTFPTIVTGAAYADLEAMGTTAVAIAVPTKGIIQSAVYYDLDDEGLQVDLWLFEIAPANVTDNSAFVVSDAQLLDVIDVIQFVGFRDANTGQVSTQNGLGIAYTASTGFIYALLQARGALNIAAGSLPHFVLRILAQ